MAGAAPAAVSCLFFLLYSTCSTLPSNLPHITTLFDSPNFTKRDLSLITVSSRSILNIIILCNILVYCCNILMGRIQNSEKIKEFRLLLHQLSGCFSCCCPDAVSHLFLIRHFACSLLPLNLPHISDITTLFDSSNFIIRVLSLIIVSSRSILNIISS